MKRLIFLFMFLVLVGISTTLYAVSDPIVFPKNGQTRQQQMTDKAECQDWSTNETGVNPDYVKAKIDALNENMADEAAGKGGGLGLGRSLIRGAALGAAMGGLDEAIDSEAGAGAAKGALLATSRARQEQKKGQQQQAIDNQYAKKEALEAEYQKYLDGFAVCMEAKGYTVR